MVLYLAGPSPRRFVARLMERSHTGFRAAHTIALLAGQERLLPAHVRGRGRAGDVEPDGWKLG